MTTRKSALIQAACISLLIMLVPVTAVPQEQNNGPSAQQPVAEPTQPQPEPTGTTSGTAEGAKQLLAAPQTVEPQATAPLAEHSNPASEENIEYVIKQGDTLWDISNTYLKDPFLWPFIWQANPSIANPDLIYAGQKLAIPSLATLEQAMQTPSEKTPKSQIVEKQVPAREETSVLRHKQVLPPEEETGGGNILILPKEQPKPIIDMYAMLSAGFVNNVEGSGVIIGAAGEPKTIFGYGDSVYVKFGSAGDVNVGDKFLIYAPLGRVNHPRTGKTCGRLIAGVGILQVTAKDPSSALATAKITLSFDTIEKDNLLTPYHEPALIYPSSVKKIKDISGYIIAVRNNQTIAGQMDFVYLDKGSSDGVDPGDNFVVYADSGNSGEPQVKIGEVQVILVKEHSSTAIVRRSTDVITSGNAVDFKK